MVVHSQVCYVRVELASTCLWGGILVSEFVGKADLLSDHFDSKQCRESVDQQLMHLLSVFKSYHIYLHVE